ncbi:solute carrier family 44 protein member 2, putative, partial [Ichthyophthirius multifiliis]
QRFTTNKSCLILWIILNSVLIQTSIYVFKDGRPQRLQNGFDFRAELCGQGKFVDRPYLYYPNPATDINVAFCVQQCPQSTGPLICLYQTNGIPYNSVYSKFCYVQMQSKPVGKYCKPYEPQNKLALDNHLLKFDLRVKRYVSDIYNSLDMIGLGAILISFLSFIFYIFIRNSNLIVIYMFSIFIFIIGCFAGYSYLFYREYQLELAQNCFTGIDEKQCVGDRGYLYRIFCYVIAVIGGIYLLTLIMIAKRLRKITSFFITVSQVVDILTQIKFIPYLLLLAAISIGGLILIMVPHGFTVADIVIIPILEGQIDGNKVKTMEFSKFSYAMAIYDIFMFFIWMFFLLGFRDIYISYCLCIWFFTKRKDTVKIPRWVVFKQIFRYHLGSVVMYSLVSACVTFPKLIMKSFIKSLSGLPQYSNTVRYLQTCCKCMIDFYEIFLRYFSKHSLIQVSLTSLDFYISSKRAYGLMFRNQDKISDMDQMQEFVVNNTKFCIAFVSALFVYVYLSFFEQTVFLKNNTKEIENKVIPSLVMFVIGYFFSAIFQGSYDITCKSLIQLYLIDQEIFFGEKRYDEEFINIVFQNYVKDDQNKYIIKSKQGVKIDQNEIEEQNYNDDEMMIKNKIRIIPVKIQKIII